MNREIFADGINAVHITGNMVRIDLMSLQPQLKKDNGQPVFDVSHRIVMPLEGFVQSLPILERTIAQLIQAGVLKRMERPDSAVDGNDTLI